MYPQVTREEEMEEPRIWEGSKGALAFEKPWGELLKVVLRNAILYIIPFSMAPSMWLVNNIYPAETLLSIPVPTAPIINNGPEVLLKERILCPSSEVMWPDLINAEVILAPDGYPEKMLIINAYAPYPDVLNNVLEIGEKT